MTIEARSGKVIAITTRERRKTQPAATEELGRKLAPATSDREQFTSLRLAVGSFLKSLGREAIFSGHFRLERGSRVTSGAIGEASHGAVMPLRRSANGKLGGGISRLAPRT